MTDAKLLSEGIFKRAEGLLVADAGDELLMMSVQLGKYFNLNPVGTRIWALLEKPMTAQALLALLIAEYNVKPEVAAAQLYTFLSDLHERGLVTVSDAQAE